MNAGATLNVVVTIFVTWNVAPFYPDLVAVWIAVVLALNLLPVALLRRTITPATPMAKRIALSTR